MSKSQQPNGASLARVESFQWPSGHVGHLSEGQQGALEKFKKLSQEKGYYTSGDGKKPASHDDETLLRYLRARKFIPQEAFGQFKSTEDWRTENRLDQLYETIDIDEYEQTRRLYPQWTGRRDKRGVPVYVFEVNHVESKALNAYESDAGTKKDKTTATSKTPRKMLRLFALYENLCRFVLPLCSAIPDRPHGETPMSQSSNIVDISGVGFAKFWSLRNHMSDASRLATAYYPETLDRIFVVGAPSFFPTVWGWAQKWFDPITVSKIFILSNKEMASTLAKYIELDHLPKKYGGTLDWTFGDMPALEPAIADTLRWKEDIKQRDAHTVPIGPIRWEYDAAGDMVAVAVGSQGGKPRSQVLASLHPEKGVAALALSPGRADNAPSALETSGAGAKQEADKAISENRSPSKPTEQAADAPKAVDIPEATHAGTVTEATVPHSEASDATSPREGTSETKFEQQGETHAGGQLAKGTPELKVDGQGEKQALMEPATVGQAPKEHPVPEPEEPAPGLFAQAQFLATSVVSQVASAPGAIIAATGLVGHKEPVEEKAAVPSDPAIDKLEKPIVEEYLRNETLSSTQDSAVAAK